LGDLQEKHVRQIRQRFLPSKSIADEAVMLIGVLWVFAKENLAMQLGPNPTTDVRRLHKRIRVYEPWPGEIIEQLLSKPTTRLAVLLLLYTGQRIGDVAAMRWSQYDGAGIGVRQQKTDALVWIPCHNTLKVALDTTARRSDFIVAPGYTAEGLSRLIKRGLRQAGAEQYTAHGLRKSAAIALAEAGCSPHEIAAITGHRSLAMVQHYTSGAEQKKLALRAIGRLANGKTTNKKGALSGETRLKLFTNLPDLIIDC
jgi:integrase